jgi:hypothetical protein
MMAQGALFPARTRETLCTIEIEDSAAWLHAHVALDAHGDIQPGDEVIVHGPPIRTRFGDKLVLRRTATIKRAGLVQRMLARWSGMFLLTELYEVSFTPRRLAP